ncbi:MAG: hypothetical protein A4S09_00250 [Proteobacteria bacterium SG_bin7]|nr:MAG: hypothetical protein A4S09_00250 [Proteobacteria bacterium SG_bin7]
MEINTIRAEFQKILQQTFERDDLVATDTLAAADVDEWDSLSHIELVVALEKHFKIKFSLPELNNVKNVGEMLLLIQRGLKK